MEEQGDKAIKDMSKLFTSVVFPLVFLDSNEKLIARQEELIGDT